MGLEGTLMDRWCSGVSVALPEVFASRFEPHQRESVALLPAYRDIKGKGSCAGSSCLISFECWKFSSRSVLGQGY